jgi:hypothetical protein
MTLQSKSAGLPIYPEYCHGLSKTIGCWCPVLASQVHELKEVEGFKGWCFGHSIRIRIPWNSADFIGQSIYFHLNHPIKWVRLTGVIVAVDHYAPRVVFTLDDSSGLNIEVICKAPPLWSPYLDPTNITADASKDYYVSPDGPKLNGIDVGSVVKVKGGLSMWNNAMQIVLKSIVRIDTNEEAKCWNDVSRFKRDVLQLPWVVDPNDEEQCRLEAVKDVKEKKRTKDERRRMRTDRTGGEVLEKPDRVKKRDRSAKREDISGNKEGKKTREYKEQVTEKDQVKRQQSGLGTVNRANYPSAAARLRAAGKYDALGI